MERALKRTNLASVKHQIARGIDDLSNVIVMSSYVLVLVLLRHMTTNRLTHDDWDDGNDTRVDSTRGPCGPATLRGSSNNEVGNVVTELAQHVVSHGVHSADDGLS